MSFTIKKQQVGPLLKLDCFISMTEEDTERISEPYNVNDLVEVHLKIEFYNRSFRCWIKTQTHKIATHFLIKVKVLCHEEYSEWICTNDGQYKSVMQYMLPLSDLSSHDKLKDVNSGLFTLTISASKIFDGLPTKLHNDEDFTDFHLSSSDGSVPIHRACLVAQSDVFKGLLSREWKETKEGRIQLKGVTLQTLKDLKRYMYLGDLPEDGLQSLLLFASCYMMEDLKAECVYKLTRTVKPEELYSLIKFAVENELLELMFALIKGTPVKVIEDAENIHIIMKKEVEEEKKDE